MYACLLGSSGGMQIVKIKRIRRYQKYKALKWFSGYKTSRLRNCCFVTSYE